MTFPSGPLRCIDESSKLSSILSSNAASTKLVKPLRPLPETNSPLLVATLFKVGAALSKVNLACLVVTFPTLSAIETETS